MAKSTPPKRKVRRFAEGDLVADKEAGLKASSGEKVGFFERLRMGNIDDPSSEAYKRFGAGRGQSERAKTVPVEDRTPVSVRDDQYNPDVKQMDALEAANAREPIKVEPGPRATSSVASSVAKPVAKAPLAKAPLAKASPAKTPKTKSDAERAENRDSYVPLTRTIPSRGTYQKVPEKPIYSNEGYGKGRTNPNYSNEGYGKSREPAQYERRRPGTNVNYENENATSETFKRGGAVKAGPKPAAVKGWGIARGARAAKMR